EKTGSEPAEPAISESHIIFLIDDLLKIETELLQRLLRLFENPRVEEIVDQQTAHQIFEREIISPARVFLSMSLNRPNHPIDDQIANHVRRRSPPVAIGCDF